jgi:hypothetical protein
MDGMLLTAYWSEELKKRLRINGMSQVWNDRPTWYFWLNQGDGPLSLQLERTDILSADHVDIKRGLFSLRLFPDPRQEDAFLRFSPEERVEMQGDHFDHTGTPGFDAISLIPDNLFHIGVMEWRLDQKQETSFFVFESLTALRIRQQGEADGSTLRDVPGWDMGFPLFDAILSLYANYRKQSPVRIVLAASPGFESIRENDGSLKDRETGDIQELAALVCFAPGGSTSGDDRHVNQQVEEFLHGTEPLADMAYPVGYDAEVSSKASSYLRVNEMWWSLAGTPPA